MTINATLKRLNASVWGSKVHTDGDWRATGATLRVHEPATNETLGVVGQSQASDLGAVMAGKAEMELSGSIDELYLAAAVGGKPTAYILSEKCR